MLSLNFSSAGKGPFLSGEANICARGVLNFSFYFWDFLGHKICKYFYGCVDLSRDFGGYSTQSDNWCSTVQACWLHISAG